jgi:hypothetical protein
MIIEFIVLMNVLKSSILKTPNLWDIGWGQIEEVSINETRLMDGMRDYPLFNLLSL